MAVVKRVGDAALKATGAGGYNVNINCGEVAGQVVMHTHVHVIPRIAGKPAADIASQMVAFKAGQRAGTIMDRIAKGFSDDEIRAIAAWYAEQK